MGSSPETTPTPSLRPSSSFETIQPTSTAPQTPAEEEQAGLIAILAVDDLAEAAWQAYDLATLPDAHPRRAHRLARALLQPGPAPSSSPTRSPAPAPNSRANQIKGAVCLLLGLHALLISREADPTCLEDLLQALVGVFIKGLIRSPRVAGQDQRLPNELAERLVGDALWDQECPWSVWQLAVHLVDRTDEALERSVAEDAEPDRQTSRILINLVYLKALLASASETQALADTRSSYQFTEVIKLGCAIGIHGGSPARPDACSPQEAHISTLVWKSRKRLELFGHVDVALAGLPDGGKDFDRWGGGAQEKTRQAEERRRRQDAEKAKLRRPTASRSRTAPTVCPAGEQDENVDAEQPGGQLLAPPVRLKGKKIRHRRAGSYEYRKPVGGGILGLNTPVKDSGVVLRPDADGLCTPPGTQPPFTCVLRDVHATSYFEYSTALMPTKRSTSFTSLPSLERRASTCLLRTPPASPALALRPDFAASLSSSLKATVPRPLPTLFSTRPIFSLAHGDFAAVDVNDEDEDDQSQRTSWLKAIRAQTLLFSFRLQPLAFFSKRKPPSPFEALFQARSPDTSQDSPPLPSLSTSLSSQSSFSSPLQSPRPIPVAQVPSIGFTPSSHHPFAASAEPGPERGGRTLKSYTPLSSRLDGRLRREL